MRFFSCLASAALAVVAVAQSASNIAFTSVPASVQAGNSYTIQWGGGDGESPVTITLRKGDANDVSTVQILTTDATGSSYKWTPTSSLVDGEDYSLSVQQGLNSINYSGQFSVSGGVDPVSASVSAVLASASAASASAASASANATASITSAAGSMTAVGSSAGTGTPMARNTTFSSAMLSTSTLTATTTSESSSETGTSASSSASSSSTGAAEAMSSHYSSPMALFCAILAAIAYAI